MRQYSIPIHHLSFSRVRFPTSRYILTVREGDAWLKSFTAHMEARNNTYDYTPTRIRQLDRLVYGGEHEWLDRYRAHNDMVKSTVPSDRLLVLNVGDVDAWARLCVFLNEMKACSEKNVTDKAFPRSNTMVQARDMQVKTTVYRTPTVNGAVSRFAYVTTVSLPPVVWSCIVWSCIVWYGMVSHKTLIIIPIGSGS